MLLVAKDIFLIVQGIRRGDTKGEIPVTIGFVLMHVSSLHENDVFNTLLKIPEVIEVHPVSGDYDLIAKIEAHDYESIVDIIVHKINIIKGITGTKTLTGKHLR
jgi:DNA-binding Lrp family transcriptional regulator